MIYMEFHLKNKAVLQKTNHRIFGEIKSCNHKIQHKKIQPQTIKQSKKQCRLFLKNNRSKIIHFPKILTSTTKNNKAVGHNKQLKQ